MKDNAGQAVGPHASRSMYWCYVLTLKALCFVYDKVYGRGMGGVVTPSRPPTNNICLYPLSILRCFWKESVMTPTTTTAFQAFFTVIPYPSTTPAPIKILIVKHWGMCSSLLNLIQTIYRTVVDSLYYWSVGPRRPSNQSDAIHGGHLAPSGVSSLKRQTT